MQRFRIGVVVMSLLVVAAAVASLPSSGAQAQGRGNSPSDVNVVNTPTVSAQQSGTWNVGLAGTPTVSAQQSGPWNVGVGGVSNRLTTSARVVMLPGESHLSFSLAAPACPDGTTFLVTDVQAGPGFLFGNTRNDVVQLPHWAVGVAVYQFSDGGAIYTGLHAMGNGPEAISASIPAGQRLLSSSVPVNLSLLGGVSAPVRFEFEVHVTGFCGVGFTS
jgi:hypothetical protein